MTLESITWAKSIVDTLFGKVAEPLLAHMSQCEKVASLWNDTESKNAYKQEFAYKMLYRLFENSTHAAEWTGGMSVADFLQDCKRAGFDPTLPQIKVSAQKQHVLEHSLCCTYYYQQYSYADIKPTEGDIVIDCGTCFGETAIWFLRCGASKVYSFEIDVDNLQVLENYVNTPNIKIVRYALGSTPGELWYTPDVNNAGAGQVSSKQQANSIHVSVTTIDSFCKEMSITPSFIKMDIEGSEYDALLGAKNIIASLKPKLAICLYHKLDDMWRIPLLIKQLVPEYKIYCKKNHPFCEFVMYAGL